MSVSYDPTAIEKVRIALGLSPLKMAQELNIPIDKYKSWVSGIAAPDANQVAQMYTVAKRYGAYFQPFVWSTAQRVWAAFERLDNLSAQTFENPEYPTRDVVVIPPNNFSLPANSTPQMKTWMRNKSVEYQGYGGAEFPYGSLHSFPEIVWSRPDPDTLTLSDKSNWPSSSYDRRFWYLTTGGVFGAKSSLQEESLWIGKTHRGNGETSLRGTMTLEWMPRDIVYPLLFAKQFLPSHESDDSIAIGYRWTKLQGRKLTVFPTSRYRHWSLLNSNAVGLSENWEYTVTINQTTDLASVARDAIENCSKIFGVEIPLKSLMNDTKEMLQRRWPTG